MIELCKFCGSEPLHRKPIYYNGRSYITNGFYALRFAGQLEDAACATEENRHMAAVMESLFPRREEPAEMLHAPHMIDPIMVTPCEKCIGRGLTKKCEECKGSGVVSFENDYSSYECECQSCNGHGARRARADEKNSERCSCCQGFGREVDEWYFADPERIGKARLSPDQMFRLSHLPMVAWAAHGNYGHFIFFGGDGVLMRIKTLQERDDAGAD